MEYALYFHGLCEPARDGVGVGSWILRRRVKRRIGSRMRVEQFDVSQGSQVVAWETHKMTQHVAAFCGLGLGLNWMRDHFNEISDIDRLLGLSNNQVVINRLTANENLFRRRDELGELRARIMTLLTQIWPDGQPDVSPRVDFSWARNNLRVAQFSRETYTTATGLAAPVRGNHSRAVTAVMPSGPTTAMPPTEHRIRRSIHRQP